MKLWKGLKDLERAAVKGMIGAGFLAFLTIRFLLANGSRISQASSWKEVADYYASIVVIFFGFLFVGALFAAALKDWRKQRSAQKESRSAGKR